MKFLKHHLTTLALILAVSGIIAVWSNPAHACRCAQRDPTAKQVMDGAKAVFWGVAKSSNPAGRNEMITTFSVVESFKGASEGKDVSIRHRSGPTPSCGVSFNTNETYIVVAQAVDGAPRLATSYCSLWMFQTPGDSAADLIDDMRSIRDR